jgi:hypothetical protein
MTLEQLRKIVYTGREIEFTYHDKNYSLTYFRNNGENGYHFANSTMILSMYLMLTLS